MFRVISLQITVAKTREIIYYIRIVVADDLIRTTRSKHLQFISLHFEALAHLFEVESQACEDNDDQNFLTSDDEFAARYNQ